MKFLKKTGFTLAGFLILLTNSGAALALSDTDANSIYSDTVWYKANGNCSVQGGALGSNIDYAGRPILNQGELKAIETNSSVYQQAAQQAGIPWQVLGALHYREHDLALDEPDDTGVYQITDSNARTPGAYPQPGSTLTSAQFLQQSIDAANYIKQKQPALNTQPNPATIKDAFALYNGLPPRYADQAAHLGYDRNTQAYEGSPYVMNMADAPRDPHDAAVVASRNWMQDRGGGNYLPASPDQYGAYVLYASLGGLTLSGDCSSGSINCPASSTTPSTQSSVRQKVVCIAEHELSLWNSGQMKAGKDFFKYSEDRNELWCTDFVSWVYNQAGYPLGPAGSPTNNWNISYVGNLLVPPQAKGKFIYHPSAGYTPKPGDMAIHSSSDNPYYHVNMVDSVKPGEIILIGGDQHGSGGSEGNVVNTETINSAADDNIIGYVGPD